MTVTMTVEEYNQLYTLSTREFNDYRDAFIKLFKGYLLDGKLEELLNSKNMWHTYGGISSWAENASQDMWYDLIQQINVERDKVVTGGVYAVPSLPDVQPEDTTPKKDKSTKRRRRERNAA